jgi:glycosyltransferase involved in cell wall biosynthesis
MKVTLSVKGRFHGFNLAQELNNRDALQTLITTYPKFMAKRFGIPAKKVISFLELEILARSYNKVRSDYSKVSHWFNNKFDNKVSKKLEECDLFVGWSGSSINSIVKAKELAMTSIVERGSSHILYQKNILEEESSLCGTSIAEIHSGVIDNELKEYEQADFISIPSNYVKRTFIDQGVPSEKLIQVPYGVNLGEFFPMKKEDEVFRFIHCGAINYRKGVHYLLQAFSELNIKNSELWVVGSIDPEIENIIKKYESENIIFHGTKPQSELKWFYSQCNVFCLASIEEGLAMVQAQALACGLPIITSENTGGSDLIIEGEHGFTFKIRDVDTLKERMLYMYEHQEEAKAMGDAARLRMGHSYSWSNYGTKIYDAYLKAIEG